MSIVGFDPTPAYEDQNGSFLMFKSKDDEC